MKLNCNAVDKIDKTLIIFSMTCFTRYLEDLAMATGYMSEIKLIEGLTVAAETLGGEIICFSFSGNA